MMGSRRRGWRRRVALCGDRDVCLGKDGNPFGICMVLAFFGVSSVFLFVFLLNTHGL